MRMTHSYENLSIYIHVPFCTVKCSYCAFNIYTHLEHLIEPYLESLISEIQIVGKHNPGHPVHTIFFGGGTPSLLTLEQFQRLLHTIRQEFNVLEDVEISTEANPNDLIDKAYLDGLYQLGFNRLSIGVQSSHESELNLFGRLHTENDVLKSIQNARKAGFDNLSVDLIYGIPNQTLNMWKTTLQKVLDLETEHISMYALGIEPKTAIEYWIRKGTLKEPDEDLAADMYEFATEKFKQSGFIQYEISNWAQPGYESIHNTQYWLNQPYLGFGPGSHGYAGGVRYELERSLHRYIKSMKDPIIIDHVFPFTPAFVNSTKVSRDDEISETIMMGLRLMQTGIELDTFESRFGVSLLNLRGDIIREYVKHDMLVLDAKRLRLTEQGRFISNRILRDLI